MIRKLMTAWNLSESDTRDILERLDAITWSGGEDLDCIEYAGTIDNPNNPNRLCGHTGYWIADQGGHIAYITNGDPFWCDWSEGCADDLSIEWGAFMAVMQHFRVNPEPIVYTVRLSDDTIGTIASETIDYQPIEGFIGEVMTVHLRDENGNPIEVTGELVEVLI